jgi:hypothetical protein
MIAPIRLSGLQIDARLPLHTQLPTASWKARPPTFVTNERRSCEHLTSNHSQRAVTASDSGLKAGLEPLHGEAVGYIYRDAI